MFNFNGNFNKSEKDLTEQVSKAIFSLLSKCNRFNIIMDLECECFDRMVVPVLLHGRDCEV